MRQVLVNKKIVVFFLVILIALAVNFYNYQKKCVTILTYHSIMQTASEIDGNFSISKSVFTEQMQYLKSAGYNVVTLKQAVDCMQSKKQLPPYPVVITFDDGYQDNFLIALPVLQKFDYQATVFVVTSFVGQEGFLTWDDINVAKSEGLNFSSHTANHAPLGKVSDAEVEAELLQSKQIFKEQTDIDIEFLAYPFGSYNEKLYPLLQENGYKAACTGESGSNTNFTQLYKLGRVNVLQSTDMIEFRIRLLASRVLGWLKHF